MLVTIESGVVSRSYDVVLQNGTKLEFDKKGNLTEIDCKMCIRDRIMKKDFNGWRELFGIQKKKEVKKKSGSKKARSK